MPCSSGGGAAAHGPSFFRLLPFKPTDFTAGLDISGAVVKTRDHIHIEYFLCGEQLGACLLKYGQRPGRADALWQHSCLELFFGIPSMPAYWECNFSLDGGWNIYGFDNYRQNMRVESSARITQLKTRSLPCGWCLSVRLALSDLPVEHLPLEIGLSAVIEKRDGELVYFALVHCREVPDFHLRQGFVIVFPAD